MGEARNAFFANLRTKLAMAKEEMAHIDDLLRRKDEVDEGFRWAITSALALGIHNVYNGLEDVLLTIARQLDRHVPVGSSLHQEILDQMTTPIRDCRPAILDKTTYDIFCELKTFRHLVRHRYGFLLDLKRVLPMVEVAQRAFISLKTSIDDLEALLTGPLPSPDEAESASRGPEPA